MDQDQRTAGDGESADKRDPAQGQPEAVTGGTHQSLFNAMLGKFTGRQDGPSGPATEQQPPTEENDPLDGDRMQHPGSNETDDPATDAPDNADAPAAKQPWWNIFRVKSNHDETSPDDDVVIEPAADPIIPQTPDTPPAGDDPAAAPGGQEQPPWETPAPPDDDRPVTLEADETAPAEPASPRAGFLARLRNLKEQLLPAADRPIAEERPEDQASDGEGTVPDPSPAEPAPAELPDTSLQAVSPAEGTGSTTAETETGAAETDTAAAAPMPSEQSPAGAQPGFFGRFAFWKKQAAPPAEPPAAGEDLPSSAAAGEAEAGVPEEGSIHGVTAPVPQDDAPPPAAQEQPMPEEEPAPAEEFRPAGISPMYHVSEFFITAGGWMAARLKAISPSPRAPIDEVLAGKLACKQQLEREIWARERDIAAMARKLRRGRFERKDILEARSKARTDLNRVQATLRSRSADVEVLEKQGMALQAEIQLAAARHESLLKDIDNGHLQWESLAGTIAQTKAQLDTVTTEISIKRNDSASLDRLMEEHRRELAAATAETARLEEVRKATEEALRDFRAQIARLDQDRISQETYVRETGAEAARIRKAFEEQSHQKDVLESVLAQLSQDVQVRQNLMQQLLDEGVRVKTETDQRLAQRDLLASAISDLSAEKEQLQLDAARFRDETRSFEETRRAAAEESGRITAELKRLQAECEEHTRRTADLSAKQEVNDLLTQKIAAMKDDGMSLAKKLDELRSQKNLAEKALNSYRRELASVDTAIAQKREERARLDQQAREVDEKIGTFKKDVALYVSQKAQLAGAIEAAHATLRTLEQQIGAKQEEHDSAEKRLLQVRASLSSAEAESQQLEGSARSRRAELEDISARHAAFAQQLDAGRSEVARLAETGKELVAGIEQNTRNKAGLIAQVQELKKIIAATAPENDRLQRKRQELEGWVREAVQFQQQQQGAIEQQLARIKQQQQEAADLTGRIEQGTARLDGLNDDLAHLEQEKAIRSQSIEDELLRLNQQLSRTNGAIKDAERELQERAEQRMAAIEAIQKLEEERDLLTSEVASLSQQAAQVKALQAKADELTATMAAGQKRLEEMFQENQRLAQEKAALQQSIQQAGAEQAETRERQRAFAEEVQQIQNNLESLRQTRDKLQEELSRQEGMLKSFAEENERSRQALAKQLDDVQNDLDDKQRQLDGAGDLLRQTESEISSKTITRDQLDTAIAQLKQQHADALAQVEAATGGIEDQKKLVQQQLDTLTAETEKSRRSYAELDKSVKDKTAEEGALLKRLKMLSTEAGQYQSMLKQWSELSRKIEEQKRVLEDLELQAEKKSGLFS